MLANHFLSVLDIWTLPWHLSCMTSFSGNSLGKVRLYEDKRNVSLSTLLCPLEMYNNHACKPVTQEFCALSTVQNMHWTGFHMVGAAPGLMPHGTQREVCREGGDTWSWDGGELAAEQSSSLVGSKAVGDSLSMASVLMPYAVSKNHPSLFTVTWSLTNLSRLIRILPSVGTNSQKLLT